MSLPETPTTFERISVNNEYCVTCPEMGSCKIVAGLMGLDEWNTDNPIVEEADDDDDETMLTRQEQDATFIRPHVGELLVDLARLQTDCVACMQAGGESLQTTAVSVMAGSRVGSLAQKERAV